MQFHTTEKATEDAGKCLSKILKTHVREPLLLLVSGGSSLDVLEYIDVRQLSDQITIGLVDERHTSEKEHSNTAKLIANSFFKVMKEQSMQLLDPRPKRKQEVQDAAHTYEGLLKEWRKEHPEAPIVVLLGVGIDGHTAGMLTMSDDPLRFDALFMDTLYWVAGYEYMEGDNQFPKRITITVPFLEKEVDEVVIYAVGDEKCDVLKRLSNALGHPAALPALTLRECNKVHVFTDCDVTGEQSPS